MKKLTKYNWLFKLIGCAILIAMVLLIQFAFKEDFIYVLTGLAITIMAIVRVVPLLKTLKSEKARTLNLIEIIVNIIIGVMLVYFAFTDSDKLTNIYKFLLASVLYVRGLIFFISATMFEEKVDKPQFLFHIAVLTGGSMIFVLENFSASTLTTAVVILCALVALYLGVDGGISYSKYRKTFTNNNNNNQPTIDSSKVEENKEKVAPIVDKDVPDDRPYIN